jgi:thiamine-monophosphate kinase
MYGEFELIERIDSLFGQHGSAEVGIGDDCALLAPGYPLVTSDTLVEGVHFRRDWSSPGDIGFKSLVASLSDVAAMGAEPGPFLLNLALGPHADEVFVDGLLQGLLEASELATGLRVAPVGGDTCASPVSTMVTVTLFGRPPEAGAVLRNGAAPGDHVYCFRPLGRSAAGLDVLRGVLTGVDASDVPLLVDSHRRPLPLVALGARIGKASIASAMIDLSDGLVQDLGHIARRSGVKLIVRESDVPVDAHVQALGERIGRDPSVWALAGGEDFGLVATVPAQKVDGLMRLCDELEIARWDIGSVVEGISGVVVVGLDGRSKDMPQSGYEHFR